MHTLLRTRAAAPACDTSQRLATVNRSSVGDDDVSNVPFHFHSRVLTRVGRSSWPVAISALTLCPVAISHIAVTQLTQFELTHLSHSLR